MDNLDTNITSDKDDKIVVSNYNLSRQQPKYTNKSYDKK